MLLLFKRKQLGGRGGGGRVSSCRKVGAELPSRSFPMLGEGRDMKPRVPKVLIALLFPFKSATVMIFLYSSVQSLSHTHLIRRISEARRGAV